MTTTALTLTDFLLARIAEDGVEGNLRHADGSLARERWERLVAECEAKRRIMAHHWKGGVHRYADDEDGPQCQACDARYCLGPCPTMRALALPYADHPDFRPEWRL